MKFSLSVLPLALFLGQAHALILETDSCKIAVVNTFKNIEPTCGVRVKEELVVQFTQISKETLDKYCSPTCMGTVSQGVTKMIGECKEEKQDMEGLFREGYKSRFNVCLKDGDEYCLGKFDAASRAAGRQRFDLPESLFDASRTELCSPCLKMYLENIKKSLKRENPERKYEGVFSELLENCPQDKLNATSDLKLPSLPKLGEAVEAKPQSVADKSDSVVHKVSAILLAMAAIAFM